MAFVGVCFNEGRRWQAILLAVLILAGEAYWVLINADREVASLDAVSAPVAEMRAARVGASSRVEKAETAKRASDAAAISEAAKKDCASNCAKLLLSAQQEADRELNAAREALAGMPEPRSTTPLSEPARDRTMAWELLLAGLRSLGITGGSLAIGMALHPRRPATVTEPEQPTRIEIIPPRPLNKREHVSHFLRATKFRPDPSGQASLRALAARYNDWASDQRLPPAELGTELRAIIEALGLKCEPSGRDVIVYGAAISD
jgi:hypothetical protein